MTAGKEHIGKMFSRAAVTYDTIGPRLFIWFGSRLAAAADIPPGAHVLDIATGRGAVLFPAAKAAGAQGFVTGIDLAEEMVAATGATIGQNGIANARVLQMDAEQLDLADASFDRVLCGFAIFFCPEPERALREFHRVLKPGGRLVMSTWARTEERRKWLAALVRCYLPAEADARKVFQWLPKGFDDPTEIHQALKDGGFSSVRIVEDTKSFCYASEEEWWQVQWSHGMRGVLETIAGLIGPEAFERFKADAFDQLRQQRTAAGIEQCLTVLYSSAVK